MEIALILFIILTIGSCIGCGILLCEFRLILDEHIILTDKTSSLQKEIIALKKSLYEDGELPDFNLRCPSIKPFSVNNINNLYDFIEALTERAGRIEDYLNIETRHEFKNKWQYVKRCKK